MLEARPREAVFSGPHLGQLPEVVFLTSPDTYPHPYAGASLFGRRASGEVARQGAHYMTRRGVLAAWGPDIGAGRTAAVSP